MSAAFFSTDDVPALLSLVRTLRRNAHGYKRWAMEAEHAGRLDQSRKYRKESDRCWRDAWWHLHFARSRGAE